MSAAPSIQLIRLSQLSASETQPRKNFDPEYLQGLADSIRDMGVIQPLNVRIKPRLFAGETEAPLFEIIFGECRCRASRIAALEEVPCIVRDWNDRQVIEAQWIENLQRKDLDPIEESEGYHALLALRDENGQPAYNVEKIAATIKKQFHYVYERLSFRDLPENGRVALLSGLIGTKIASVIARIPDPAARAQAAERIIKPDFQDAPLTVRQATELVKRDYMRQLRQAPFETEDATLVPNMGACGPCPYRSGNAKVGFGEMSGHLCTNPECFRLKAEVTWTRAQEHARAAGKRVLSPVEAEKLFTDDGKLRWDKEWVRLLDQPSGDLLVSSSKQPPKWRDLLKASAFHPEVCVARAPNGSVHEIVLLSEALQAGRIARPELFKPVKGAAAPATERQYTLESETDQGSAPPPADSKQPEGPSAAEREAERIKAERLKAKIDIAVLREVTAALVGAVDQDSASCAPGIKSKGDWVYWFAMLPLVLAHAGDQAKSIVADRRKLLREWFDGEPVACTEMILTGIESSELPGLIAELLWTQFTAWQAGECSPLLQPLLVAFSIDVPAIRARVTAELTPKPAEPPPPKKKRAKKTAATPAKTKKARKTQEE
jgi:ParB/RepB/Spo0J family partition protein